MLDILKQLHYELKEYKSNGSKSIRLRDTIYILFHLKTCDSPCENCDNLVCAIRPKEYKYRCKRLIYCKGQL